MKVFTFNPRGLFMDYMMFLSGETRDYYVRTEWSICELARHFMWHSFTLIIRIAFALFFVAGISYKLGSEFNAKFELIANTSWFSHIAILFIGVLAEALTIGIVIGFLCCCMLIAEMFGTWRARHKSTPTVGEPGILKLMYKSLKDKTCFKVQFK